MRNLIAILLFLLPLSSIGQSIQYQGTTTTLVKHRGGIGADSIIQIPVRDTTKWINSYGNLTIRPQDNSVWYRANGIWQKIGSGSSGDDSANIFTGTLSQCRALTSTPDLIVTNDYGGGTWFKNDTVTVDNTGTQIITAGGQGYSRVYDVIRPEYFGAMSNDTIDDAPSINKAILFAELYNSKVWLDGNYLLKSQVYLRNSPVFGGANNKITINETFSFADTIDGRRYSCILNNNFSNIFTEYANSVQLYGLNIECRITDTTRSPNVIGLANVKYGVLEDINITVVDSGIARTTALDLWACVKNVTVSRPIINYLLQSNVGGALWVRNITGAGANDTNATENITIRDGEIFHAGKDEPLAIYGVRGLTRNVLVENMKLTALPSSKIHSVLASCFPLNDGSSGGVYAAVDNIHFNNCTLVDTVFSNHVLRIGQSADVGQKCDNVTVSNCKFYASKSVSEVSYVMRNIKNIGNNIRAMNNTIYADKTIQNIAYGIGGFDFVSGNYINGKFTYALNNIGIATNNEVINPAGVGALNVSRLIDNKFYTRSSGALVQGNSEYLIHNNYIETTDTALTPNFAVWAQSLAGSNPNTTITSNKIKLARTGTYGMRKEGLGICIIKDNNTEGPSGIQRISLSGSEITKIESNVWNGVFDVSDTGYVKVDGQTMTRPLFMGTNNGQGVRIKINNGTTHGVSFNIGQTLFGAQITDTIQHGVLAGTPAKIAALTGFGSGSYYEGMVMRHAVQGGTAVPRYIIYGGKVSNESSAGEAAKFGGLAIGSSSAFANNTEAYIFVGDVDKKGLTVSSNLDVTIGNRLSMAADAYTTGGNNLLVKNTTNGRVETIPTTTFYTKAQVDSIAAASGGTVYASNGVHKDGDTLQLGLELAPPYTNGLITKSTFVVGGTAAGNKIYGLFVDPLNSVYTTVGGKKNDTRTQIDFGDATGAGMPEGIRHTVVNDAISVGTTFQMMEDSISIGSGTGSPTFKGLVYVEDYSSAFNSDDRAIPDVGWVKDNIGTGWASYTDTLYRSATPFNISSGTTDTLENRAHTSTLTQLPLGVSSLYNPVTKKLLAATLGDAYTISIRFKAKNSVQNGYFTATFDVGGSLQFAVSETKTFAKGAGIEHSFVLDYDVFAGALWLANGGTLKITADSGNLQIYDINYLITRTHKGR